MKPIFLFFLILSQLQANCFQFALELTPSPWGSFRTLPSSDIFKHRDNIILASKNLGLSPKEFLKRLDTTRVSLDDFFTLVEDYRQGRKIPTIELILNPAKLARLLKEGLQGRQIRSTNFLTTASILTVANSLSMIWSHYLNIGAEQWERIGTQLVALTITEIALTMGTTKHAAYIVARPEAYQQSEKFARTLSPEILEKVNIITKSRMVMDRMKYEAKGLFRDTFKEAFPLTAISFAAGLVPYAFKASMDYEALSDIAMATFMDTSFHALFIGLWANLRYHLLKDRLFPFINRAFANRRAQELTDNKALNRKLFIAENVLVILILGNNINIASETYVRGSDSIELLKTELAEDNDSF